MNVAGITSFSFQNAQKNGSPVFKGHWVTKIVPAPYPHEDTFTRVSTYIADEDETIDEIERNFEAKAHNKNFLRPHDIYSLNDNYFAEVGNNTEVKKMKLTLRADNKLERHDYIGAVQDKIKIAKILERQGKERDKFLTEEGIRQIYTLADYDSKNEITAAVWNYNPDMAKSLEKQTKRF